MNLGQSISHCFSNYFNFNGRSSRSEFWWFELFAISLSVLEVYGMLQWEILAAVE